LASGPSAVGEFRIDVIIKLVIDLVKGSRGHFLQYFIPILSVLSLGVDQSYFLLLIEGLFDIFWFIEIEPDAVDLNSVFII
jgi:hypothetical protein